MIALRLSEIDIWYKEAHADLNRPELLSKLAVLEMCGWIEEEFDLVIRDVDALSLRDSEWVNDNIISKNSGFTYDTHLRQMLVKLIGEFLVKRIEAALEVSHPGDLAQLRNLLLQLWRMRCALAHTALAAAPHRQYTLNAPSITMMQYNSLNVLVSRFRALVISEIQGL